MGQLLSLCGNKMSRAFESTGHGRRRMRRRKTEESKGERLRYEDVFNEVVRRFASSSEFWKFARASKGLKMQDYDIDAIKENCKGDIEGCKIKVLRRWKQDNQGRNSSPKKLLDIVNRFLSSSNGSDAYTGDGIKKRKNCTKQFRGSTENHGSRSSHFAVHEHLIVADLIAWLDTPLLSNLGINILLLFKALVSTDESTPVESEEEPVQASDDQELSRNRSQSTSGRLFGPGFAFGLICGTFLALTLLAIFNHRNTDVHKDDGQFSALQSNIKCNLPDTELQKLWKRVNEASRKIASSSGIPELEEPSSRIYPKTYISNFYDTGSYEQAYIPETDISQTGPKQSGAEVHMPDFFNSTDGSPTRYVALIGGAGYGKTEMLKRYTIDVLDKKYPSMKRIKIVRFLSLRNLRRNRTVSAQKLLFGRLKFSQEQLNCLLSFILNQPHEFLFVLDGIDQFPEKIGPRSTHVDLEETNEQHEILAALLSGNLFPKVRILISSRQDAIRHFEGDMRPEQCIALSGFTHASIEKLIRAFGGTDGDLIWNHLKTHSPTLLPLSSIPMFLVFSVLVLKRHRDPPPETLSEVLMHLLHHHITSEHTHDDILDVIQKLKPMSYHGLENSKITFTVSDLPAGLNIEDARDLMFPMPGIKTRNQRLFDGHFQISFCHQSLQEALAALHVAEMPVNEFENFVAEELHKDNWVIVRRLVAGLVLNPRTKKVAQGLDRTVSILNVTLHGNELAKKQDILKRSLKTQLDILQDGKYRRNLLELFHAFHECGQSVEDIIQTSLQEINFLNIPLTQSDFHVLLFTISKRPNLMLLSLINCKLDTEGMHELARTFKQLGPDFKDHLPSETALAVLDMIPYVADLFWIAYKVDQSHIERFQKTINSLDRADKSLTVVCWRKDTDRLVMLKYQEGP